MEDSYEQGHQLRALAMRVAALEDNVAFLERWCEEQQDALDRAVGSVAYDYEVDDLPPPTLLRVVDLRDDIADRELDGTDDVVAFIDSDDDRTLRVLRSQLHRLRIRLAASLAPPDELPGERPRPTAAARVKPAPKVSAKPAGRTAP